MATTAAPADFETAMAAEEKAKLQKHFSRFDIYFFLICTIVGVDTLGQVASNGAQGFTWLIVLAVLFFVPYALLTAELGAAFTEEGGAYVWTRLAFGRFVAASTPSSTGSRTRSGSAASLALLTIEAVNIYFFDISTGGCPVVRRRPRLHLVLASGRRSSRSASASGSRRSAPGAGSFVLGLLHDHHHHLRDQARAQPAGGGEFSPTYSAVHRPRAGALLQLRRLRAAERGRRRDEGSAEGRARSRCSAPASRRSCCTACRSWRSSACCRSSRSPASAASWTRSRPSSRVYGGTATSRRRHVDVTLTGAEGDRQLAARLHPRARLERLHLADGLRPQPGRRGLRRRRPALLGTFSAKLGTPINVNFLSGMLSTIVFIGASQLERQRGQRPST